MYVSGITFIRYVSGITFIRYVSGITFIMYVSGITFFMYAQSRKIRKPNKCARISILSPTIFYWTLELFLQCSIVDAILLHVVIDITLIVFYCMLLLTLHLIVCYSWLNCIWHWNEVPYVLENNKNYILWTKCRYGVHISMLYLSVWHTLMLSVTLNNNSSFSHGSQVHHWLRKLMYRKNTIELSTVTDILYHKGRDV